MGNRQRYLVYWGKIEKYFRMMRMKINEKVILINVARTWNPTRSVVELDDKTMGNWVINKEHAEKACYAFAVFGSIIRQVYKIKPGSWKKVHLKDITELERKAATKDRWRFEGEIADELVHYVGIDVQQYYPRGAQNPIRYINC